MHHLDSNFGSSICVIWTWRRRHSEMSWTLPWWDLDLLLFQYSGDNTSGLLPASQPARHAGLNPVQQQQQSLSQTPSIYIHFGKYDIWLPIHASEYVTDQSIEDDQSIIIHCLVWYLLGCGWLPRAQHSHMYVFKAVKEKNTR